MSTGVRRRQQQQRNADKTPESAAPTVSETLSKAFTSEAKWEDKVGGAITDLGLNLVYALYTLACPTFNKNQKMQKNYPGQAKNTSWLSNCVHFPTLGGHCVACPRI